MNKTLFCILLTLQLFTLLIISDLALFSSNFANAILGNISSSIVLPILFLGPVLSFIIGIYNAIVKKSYQLLSITVIVVIICYLLLNKINRDISPLVEFFDKIF